MPIEMRVNASKLEGPEPIPGGFYDLRFEGFKPKKSKKGDSINYNPQLVVVNNPEYDGSKPNSKPRVVFTNLNSTADWVINDFVHALGMTMEDVGGGQLKIPGQFDGDPNNPETWTYQGPLLGRVMKAEVIVDNYQGKDSNKIKQFICAVPNCATLFPKIKHSTKLS